MKTPLIPLKQWVHEQSELNGITPHCLYSRLSRGKVKYPPCNRINSRIIMVENIRLETNPPKPKFFRVKKTAPPAPYGCIRLARWVSERAKSEGVTISAIHTRIWRGKLKLKIVRTGTRHVWVKLSDEDVPHYNPGE